jgi:hypothetical protein
MKSIIDGTYSGLDKYSITQATFFFTFITSAIGLPVFQSIFKWIENNPEAKTPLNYWLIISIDALLTAIVWALATGLLSLLIEKIFIWKSRYSWPKYFVYAFMLKDKKPILGFMRIDIAQSGKLVIDGYSYDVSENTNTNIFELNDSTQVTWKSEFICGENNPRSQNAFCHIMYLIDPEVANRRDYTQGLLKFREFTKAVDIKPGISQDIRKMIDNVTEDQYIGGQHSINDSTNVTMSWNFAYAESVYCKYHTDRESKAYVKEHLEKNSNTLLLILNGLHDKVRNNL